MLPLHYRAVNEAHFAWLSRPNAARGRSSLKVGPAADDVKGDGAARPSGQIERLPRPLRMGYTDGRSTQGRPAVCRRFHRPPITGANHRAREKVNTDLERREIYFSGRVQGVGFRYTTRAIALRYPVGGFVQNLPDGLVLVVVEGSTRALDNLVEAIEAEMDRHIAHKDVTLLPPTHEFAGFEVRHY